MSEEKFEPMEAWEKKRQREIIDALYEKVLEQIDGIDEMSPMAACRVIDQAMKFDDYYQRSIIRLKLRQTLNEAASVKGGETAGKSVELGPWAAHCHDETSLLEKAEQILETHKDLIK